MQYEEESNLRSNLEELIWAHHDLQKKILRIEEEISFLEEELKKEDEGPQCYEEGAEEAKECRGNR